MLKSAFLGTISCATLGFALWTQIQAPGVYPAVLIPNLAVTYLSLDGLLKHWDLKS